MAHGDAREGKWRGNWRTEWVANTLHTTSEHGVSSITPADAHTSATSSQLSWRPCRFKWTRPFRRKTKSGFCACAITFQTQYNTCYWQAATDARLKQDNAEFHYRCSGVVTQTSVRPLNAVGSSVTPSTFRLQTPISADRECSSLQFTFRYCGVDQQMNVDGVPHASGIPN